MNIIPRSGWNAAPARSRYQIATPTRDLWLHHTASASIDVGIKGQWWDDVRGIQAFHQGPQRGWSDIAYSFLIGGGQAFEGRGAGITGGHTKGHNTTSHAICLVGDYSWMEPKAEDLEAIAQLVAHGINHGWWRGLTGAHRDASGQNTTCCGDLLAREIPNIRKRVDEILNPQEEDMTAAIIAAYITGGRTPDRIDFPEVCAWVAAVEAGDDLNKVTAYITWHVSENG